MTVLTIIGLGSMGSAVGGRLVQAGVEVRTVLDGRSGASIGRAAAAGIRAVPVAMPVEADFILSIVPPDKARQVAETLVPHLAALDRKPVYVDCNAVSPATARDIAAIVAPTLAPFVDGAIIGSPPSEAKAGPVFYASGEHARRFAELGRYGLVVAPLAAPIGVASALKMSYAGITKGLIALVTAMSLAATRAGVAAALRTEIGSSQPALRARFQRAIPDMFGKARRWAPELDEIAAFVGDDYPESRIFSAIAEFYERIADGVDQRAAETSALLTFWDDEPPK